MTDAEKLAYTVTRERIVNQIDKLKASGGSDSIIKRLGRFGNAFSWYPEFYPQILADINGMSDAELMSALRTEEGFMKLIAPVEGLPIHHKVANRTGGDIPIRTPTDTFLDVRKMFFDKYGGFPGNSGWNLGAHGAFDERMHQGRYGAKDTVFDPRFGYGMPPTEELPIAHGKGTKNIGRALGEDPVLIRSSAQEIFSQLDKFVKPQIAKFQEIASNPVTLKQRAIIQKAIDADAFAEGRTIEQSTAVREAAKAKGVDIEYAKAFQYDFSKGTATLITDPQQVQEQMQRFENRLMRRRVATGLALGGVAALGPLGTAASAAEFSERSQIAQETGDFADEAQAGLAGVSLAADVASYFPPAAPIGEAVSTTADVANIGIDLYRKDPERAKKFARETISKAVPKPPVVQQVQQVQRAAQAVQRGGKVKFKAGKAQFTLPEFGLSELLGIN